VNKIAVTCYTKSHYWRVLENEFA